MCVSIWPQLAALVLKRRSGRLVLDLGIVPVGSGARPTFEENAPLWPIHDVLVGCLVELVLRIES
jgi:hypothetical protein